MSQDLSIEIESLKKSFDESNVEAAIRDSFKNVLDEFYLFFKGSVDLKSKINKIESRKGNMLSSKEVAELTISTEKALALKNLIINGIILNGWFEKISELKEDNVITHVRRLSREELKTVLPSKAFEIESKCDMSIESEPGKYLYDQLSSYILTYKETKDTYYAPYTAIVQSSGFGKTKQFGFLSKWCFVIYASLSDVGSTSYPRRSDIADFLLNPSVESYEEIESKFQTYFYCYINYLRDKKLSNSNEIFKNCIEPDNIENNKIVSQVKAKHKTQMETIEEIKKLETQKNTTQAIKELQSQIKTTMAIKELQSQIKTIFVFDEARSLIKTKLTLQNAKENENEKENYFIILRRTLKKLPKNTFVVFTDTLSYLSNFTPASLLDPSSRIAESKFNLFDPIYSIPTWDIFANMNNLSPEKLDSIENIVSYGRPLWYAFYKSIIDLNDDNMNPEYVISLAKTKMLCNQNLDKKSNISEELALALIGCRAQIDIDPKSHEAALLVANYMRICLCIDKSRTNLYTMYSSEPILAEASALICSTEGFYEKIVSKIRNSITNGVICQGNIGELTARIILLMGMDRCSSTNDSLTYTRKVSVETYLIRIIGSEKLNEIRKNYEMNGLSKTKIEKLLNAVLFFNHFVQFKKSPTFKELQQLIKRCAACICSHNEKYVDLILPILFDPLDFNSLGFVLIQIKNYKDPVLPKRVEFLNPFSLNLVNEICADDEQNLPFLALYIELGGSSEQSARVHDKKGSVSKNLSVKDKKDLDLESKFTNKKKLDEKEYEALKTYVKHNQFFVYLKGINTKSFSFLSQNEVIELQRLCQSKNEVISKFINNDTALKVYEKITYLGFINH